LQPSSTLAGGLHSTKLCLQQWDQPHLNRPSNNSALDASLTLLCFILL